VYPQPSIASSGYHRPKEREDGRGRGKRRGRVLKPLLLLFLCLLLSYLAWSFLSPYFGKRYWTLAVFGVDSRDGKLEAGALSDVIMVASLDRRSGRIELVSVFRDTYAKIGEKEYHKLNEAFFKGGHKQALEALEKNLDLSIDDYVSFNWAAVAKAINALGGVDLEISDAEFFYIPLLLASGVYSVMTRCLMRCPKSSKYIARSLLTHLSTNHSLWIDYYEEMSKVIRS